MRHLPVDGCVESGTVGTHLTPLRYLGDHDLNVHTAMMAVQNLLNERTIQHLWNNGSVGPDGAREEQMCGQGELQFRWFR